MDTEIGTSYNFHMSQNILLLICLQPLRKPSLTCKPHREAWLTSANLCPALHFTAFHLRILAAFLYLPLPVLFPLGFSQSSQLSRLTTSSTIVFQLLKPQTIPLLL